MPSNQSEVKAARRLRQDDDPEAGPGRGGLKPVQGFAIVAGILLAIVVVVALTRSDPPTNSSADPSRATFTPTEPVDDLRLTDAEAIERFKELDALKLRAYRSRNPELVARIYSGESRLRRVARREIHQLANSNVLAKTRFVTRRLEVLSNDEAEVRLLQDVLVYPRFVSEAGDEVTGSGIPEHQRIRITIQREGPRWLVYDSVIIFAKPLKGSR